MNKPRTPRVLPGKPAHSPRGSGPAAVKRVSPSAKSLRAGLKSWFVSDGNDQARNYTGLLFPDQSTVNYPLGGKKWIYCPSGESAGGLVGLSGQTSQTPLPFAAAPWAASFTLLPAPLGAGFAANDGGHMLILGDGALMTLQFSGQSVQFLADGDHQIEWSWNGQNAATPLTFVAQVNSSLEQFLYAGDGTSASGSLSAASFAEIFDWGDTGYNGFSALDYIMRNLLVWTRILTTAEINYLLAGGLPIL